jgi:hypothetical protein
VDADRLTFAALTLTGRTLIGGHLYRAPSGDVVPAVVEDEFDLVVSLCRRDGHGPAAGIADHVREVPDAALTAPQLADVCELAEIAAAAVRDRQKVLVRCHSGFNRSGLVVVQALGHLGYGVEDAIFLVRYLRSRCALNNDLFVEAARGKSGGPAPGLPEEPSPRTGASAARCRARALLQAAIAAAARRARESALAVRTRQRYEQVQALRAQGKGTKPIAHQTGLAKETVRRFYRAATIDELLAKAKDGRPSRLDDYKPYLHQRWNEGCTNVRQLPRRSARSALARMRWWGPIGSRTHVNPFRSGHAA